MFNRSGNTFCLYQLPYIQFVFIVFIAQPQPPCPSVSEKKTKYHQFRPGISPRTRRYPAQASTEIHIVLTAYNERYSRFRLYRSNERLSIKETSETVDPIFHYQIIHPTKNTANSQITKPKETHQVSAIHPALP